MAEVHWFPSWAAPSELKKMTVTSLVAKGVDAAASVKAAFITTPINKAHDVIYSATDKVRDATAQVRSARDSAWSNSLNFVQRRIDQVLPDAPGASVEIKGEAATAPEDASLRSIGSALRQKASKAFVTGARLLPTDRLAAVLPIDLLDYDRRASRYAQLEEKSAALKAAIHAKVDPISQTVRDESQAALAKVHAQMDKLHSQLGRLSNGLHDGYERVSAPAVASLASQKAKIQQEVETVVTPVLNKAAPVLATLKSRVRVAASAAKPLLSQSFKYLSSRPLYMIPSDTFAGLKHITQIRSEFKTGDFAEVDSNVAGLFAAVLQVVDFRTYRAPADQTVEVTAPSVVSPVSTNAAPSPVIEQQKAVATSSEADQDVAAAESSAQ